MNLKTLTQRERWAVFGAAIFLAVLMLFLAVDAVSERYQRMEQDIQTQKARLQEILRLGDQYRTVNQELEAVKSKLDRKEAGFSVLSFLEDLANQQNIRENISSFKPKKTPLNEVYNELSVETVIDNITLWQLVQFIYKIENSGHLVKVKRLRIKTRYDNPDLLNVTFQVSTFERI